MSTTSELTPDDLDLLKRWEDAGIVSREITRHRAPEKHRAAKIIVSAFVLGTAVTGIALARHRTTDGTDQAHVESVIGGSWQFEDEPVSPVFTPPVTPPGDRAGEHVSRGSQRQLPAAPLARSSRAITRTWTRPVAGGLLRRCWGVTNGEMHTGVDVHVVTGTRVRSTGDGVVVQVGRRFDDLGVTVIVDHQDGYMSLYGNLSGTIVEVGQLVSAGDTLARVATATPVSETHLHIGVSFTGDVNTVTQTLVDPLPWFTSRGVDLGQCGVGSPTQSPKPQPTD